MKKREFIAFMPYDQVGMEQHLEKMARRGWQLESISSLWTYRRVEPAERKFSVTYCPKASYYAPQPSEDQQTFYDYCQDAGWDLVCESGVFQIFMANRPNPIPMDTDPQQKLDTACAAMKKIYGPAHIFLLLVSVFQIWIQVNNLITDPLNFFSDYFGLSQLLAWILIPAAQILAYVGYRHWKGACQQSLDSGEAYLEGHDRFRWLTRWFLGVALLGVLVSMAGLWSYTTTAFTLLAGVIPPLLAIAIAIFLSKWMKKQGCPPVVHVLIIIGVAVGVSMGGIALGSYLIFNNVISLEEEATRTYTYESDPHTVNLYDHPIPLKVEDLQEVDFPNYSYEMKESSTLFLTTLKAWQMGYGSWDDPNGNPSVPDLEYTLLTPHTSWIYDMALEAMCTKYHYSWSPEEEWDDFLPIDPTPWGVDAAYQRETYDARVVSEYILEEDGQILWIRFDDFTGDFPSQSQIDTVVETLL